MKLALSACIIILLTGCTTYPVISPTTEIPSVSVQGINIIPLWLPVSQRYIDSCNKAYLQKYCVGTIEGIDTLGNYYRISFFIAKSKADSLRNTSDSLRKVITWLVKTAKQQVPVPTVQGFTKDNMDAKFNEGFKSAKDQSHSTLVWTVVGLGIIIVGLGGLVLFLGSKAKAVKTIIPA